MCYQRFAAYFVPQGTELAHFGATWLGWDINQGHGIDLPKSPAFDHSAIVKRPQKYGFHATLAAPFALADGCNLADLEQAVATVAARHTAFDLPLKLGKLGRFFALIPSDDVALISALAADLVITCDPLRQPLTDADLQRRRKARLSPEQDALLQRWGYPYVLDEFRFHMTLTGPVEYALQTTVEQELMRHLSPILAQSQPIGHICIAGQDDSGRFHSIRQIALGR